MVSWVFMGPGNHTILGLVIIRISYNIPSLTADRLPAPPPGPPGPPGSKKSKKIVKTKVVDLVEPVISKAVAPRDHFSKAGL